MKQFVRDELIELIAKGKTIADIGKMYGLSASSIAKRLKDIGVKTPGRGRPRKGLDSELEAAYDRVVLSRNLSMEEAAAQLQMSVRSLQRKFRKIRHDRHPHTKAAGHR